LNAEALIESLSDVVRRHEVLRTTFRWEDGQLFQVVHAELPIAMPITDLSGLSTERQHEIVQQILVEETNLPFDLLRGPIIRPRLLRLSTEEHVFLFNIHHIAFDAWSVPVFYHELAAGYTARVRGTAARLPELPIQYADYAVWQRERMSGAFLEEHLAFWRRQLEGVVPLDLPSDRPRPEVVSHHGASRRVGFEAPLISQLNALAREEGASVFMTLLAANAVLLSRYSGQEDIAIGIGVAERDRPVVQPLIGFFPNTIVLRIDLSGRPTFRQLLGRVRTVARAAYAHAELPFDLLVQELRPRRDASGTPFFRVYFALDDTPETLPDFNVLEADLVAPEFLSAKFDLAFNVSINPSRPGMYGVFSTDLFEPDTIDRMLGHYRTVLEAAITAPDRPVTELPMLTSAERRQVFAEWNDTEREFPADKCLHQLFEDKVDVIPDATAVVCGEQTMSYRSLEAHANQLAHRLRTLGVGTETVVGICVPRSPDLIISILGVLKAGGAYLPLDPDYPPDRLEFMLSDSKSWGVLTQEPLRTRLGGGKFPTLCVDSEPFGSEPARRPDLAVDPDNLAYVIYTSGSTGKPKGIALRHRGAVNNFSDFNDRFAIGPGDGLLAVSSPSFDMSVYDVLGMLAAGATVVLPEPNASRDPTAWARLLREHNVTIWHSAPALLELLLESIQRNGGDSLPGLRLALLGGDWISVTLPDRLEEVMPNGLFVGLGGATEASMDSIIYLVEGTDPRWSTIPYGRPMANQRAYILDPNLQPVPVGVPGELHLAGVGLARGYVNQPELTAERFVEHTFDDGPRERLYKTGDLARYRADGVIELLGRMDFQVKIQGLRVELGEVESLLRCHEVVEDAVVVARCDGGRTSLAAFYVPRPDRKTTAAQLRQWLARDLPDYMVPSAFVQLERLPTTPNGKVDRSALSGWKINRVSEGEGPHDEFDERVAAAWREVLGLEKISIDDSFFDLGGDSFAAIRAALAIGGSLPVVEVFKNPTIRALAAHLRSSKGRPTRLLHELTSAGPRPELSLICVPYGGGNAIAYQPLASHLPATFSLWSLDLPGHDPSSVDDRFLSVEEAAQCCADEIEQTIRGPVAIYGHCAGVALAVELARAVEDRGIELCAAYVGAALPDPDPEYSLRREPSTSDEVIYDFLRSLGGFDGPLSGATVSQILRAVRSDLIESSKFFQKSYADPPRKLRAPLLCICGDLDPATERYETRFHEWELFAASVELAVIAGGGHYFVRSHANELAELIARCHRELADGDNVVSCFGLAPH
jgi:amino acid adenylation domain-containing protein